MSHHERFPLHARIRRLLPAGALAAVAIMLGVVPAAAQAAQQVITSPGPLTSIFLNDDLGCQVQAAGDTSPSFFGGTNPGACGTFLATSNGVASPTLFGPSPPAGVTPTADFTPVSQTVSGNTVTSTVHALDPANGGLVATIVETDSYVPGQNFYTTNVQLTNNLANTNLTGALYHAGDCFLANQDTGFGALGGGNAPECTINPNNTPSGRFMAFSPVATPAFPVTAANFFESGFSTVWANVTSAGTQFPNTVDATTQQDNGMGLSWAIASLAPAASATLQFTTTVSPGSNPVSSTNFGGGCLPSGQVPVSVSAVNGAQQVNYVDNGVGTQSVGTDASGNAVIPLAAGQHTLEFWGQDKSGNQETPHHVISVTVASGGPTLTITSDQGMTSYEVGDHTSVTIAASGPALTSDPSAAHVPISTAKPGNFSVTRTASDPCGTTTASFAYTVIPPPVLGKSFNVGPVSGTTFVKLPGHSAAAGSAARAALGAPWPAGGVSASEALNLGQGFIPLAQARQVPVGSILNTLSGVASVTGATAAKNKFQTGDFGAGLFKLLQNRRQRGLTQLNLINARTARKVCVAAGKASISRRRLSSKVLGLLNSSARGKFTTSGQYSAATVRGTVWTIANRCDGTLTRVSRGVVVVRDFRRHRNITVRAGHSYLARAPGG